ncbi:MAG: hypothetical protein AB7Q16_22950 [Vicinamibacterales bacterium]
MPLADRLVLPADEAVTQKYGFIGRSGSGKSYGSMKLAELFLCAGAQIIALDWVGIWWSLRLAAGGKAPGFEHVYIFGGEHADVPLEPTSGGLMADLIVDKHISVVLDVMHFRKAERTRFATAFAEQFFHRKKTARTACHLFIEEAQAYLPQMVRGDEARMVGVFEDIGKVGRNYGIGTTLISQRPQAINKDVLNQIEVLLAFQTNGPQERKAIAGWTAENTAAGAAMMQQLPGLPVGDALVWSPQWLRVATRVHIAARDTYNASSTPTQQARTVAPKRLAKEDLDAIAADLASTIEKAKAEDPKALRKRIAELERTVAQQTPPEVSKSATGRPPAASTRVEFLTDADRKLLEQLAVALRRRADQVAEVFAAAESRVDRLVQQAVAEYLQTVRNLHMEVGADVAKLLDRVGFQRVLEKLDRVSAPASPRPAVPGPQLRISPSTNPGLARPGATRAAEVGLARHVVGQSTGDDLTGPERRILDALAWLEAVGNTEPELAAVAFLAGYTVDGGAFNNPRGKLRGRGHVEYVAGGRMRLTDTGRALARMPEVPLTSEELQHRVLERLPGPEQRLLTPLLAAYPKAMTNEALAHAAGYTPGAGAFNNPRGRLRSLGLVEYPQPGHVVAKSVLFL